MVPGQSTEDLGQPSRPMRAGEDEEKSRRSSRRHLRKLPAAAGKAAGAECARCQQQRRHCLGMAGGGGKQPREATGLPGHAASVSDSPRGENCG